MSTTFRRLAVIAVVVALLVGTGCVQQPEPAPEPAPTPAPTVTPEPAAQTELVRVYLTRGEKIGVGGREVEAADDEVTTLAEAAMTALLEGPTAEETEFGLGTTIPEGTKLNGVEIDGDVATVDMSKQFESGGGSLSMLLRVTQVVCTLTQFDGVERVAFKLDGKPVKAIGGEGIIVDPPVGRDDFEGQLPAILVEEPYPGQAISSPVPVSGSSNVFEAVHQIEVTDPEGVIVAEKTVTATSGTGTRGTWSEQIEYVNAYPGRLGEIICFELSAKDGSRVNIVEVPVRME